MTKEEMRDRAIKNDVRRMEFGMMPIYCDPARPLTQQERREFMRGGLKDIVAEDGSVWEPYVRLSYLVWRRKE